MSRLVVKASSADNRRLVKLIRTMSMSPSRVNLAEDIIKYLDKNKTDLFLYKNPGKHPTAYEDTGRRKSEILVFIIKRKLGNI